MFLKRKKRISISVCDGKFLFVRLVKTLSSESLIHLLLASFKVLFSSFYCVCNFHCNWRLLIHGDNKLTPFMTLISAWLLYYLLKCTTDSYPGRSNTLRVEFSMLNRRLRSIIRGNSAFERIFFVGKAGERKWKVSRDVRWCWCRVHFLRHDWKGKTWLSGKIFMVWNESMLFDQLYERKVRKIVTFRKVAKNSAPMIISRLNFKRKLFSSKP